MTILKLFRHCYPRLRRAFENPKVALVGGKCLPKYEGQVPELLSAMWAPNDRGERIVGYLSLIDLGDFPKMVDPLLVFGCNFSIRRSVLLAAGGFHPDGLPEQLICFRGDGETYVSRYIAAKGYNAFYDPERVSLSSCPTKSDDFRVFVSARVQRRKSLVPLQRYGLRTVRTVTFNPC